MSESNITEGASRGAQCTEECIDQSAENILDASSPAAGFMAYGRAATRLDCICGAAEKQPSRG